MTSDHFLIISPTAGFANRLRATNSALILAEATGRKLLHRWLPTQTNHPQKHIHYLEHIRLEDIFEYGEGMRPAPDTYQPQLVLSEWVQGDYWFPYQSSAQSFFQHYAKERSRDTAAQVLLSKATTILIETSLRFWPYEHPGIADGLPPLIERPSIQAAYKKIPPSKFYLKILDSFDNCSAGIAIRRGDLLNYNYSSNQDPDFIVSCVRSIASEYDTVAVFSDDHAFSLEIQLKAGIKVFGSRFNDLVGKLLPHQKAALTFFFLALKCNTIFGTPGSSFAQEAALYGGQRYFSLGENI